MPYIFLAVVKRLSNESTCNRPSQIARLERKVFTRPAPVHGLPGEKETGFGGEAKARAIDCLKEVPAQ
jgi:hypothetical protein